MEKNQTQNEHTSQMSLTVEQTARCINLLYDIAKEYENISTDREKSLDRLARLSFKARQIFLEE